MVGFSFQVKVSIFDCSKNDMKASNSLKVRGVFWICIGLVDVFNAFQPVIPDVILHKLFCQSSSHLFGISSKRDEILGVSVVVIVIS